MKYTFAMLLTGAALLACDDTVPPAADMSPSLRNDGAVLLPPDGEDMGVIMTADAELPTLDSRVTDAAPSMADEGVERDAIPGPGGACEGGETQLCVGQCGVARCVDGVFGDCQPAAEACNGHDDNCDGREDEGYAGLGIGCIVEVEGCVSQGTRVCAEDGSGVECDAPPVEAQAEVCDGADNDCDGATDEDFPGRVCCTDDLQCGPGESCEDNECVGGPGPGPGPGEGCVTDFDCDLFEVCVAGECRPFCFSDLDCGPGESCQAGACVPAEPDCVADADCPAGFQCVAGACVRPDCVVDADCPGAQVCQDGVCARPPGVTSCGGAIVMEGFGQYPANSVGAFDDVESGCGPADDGPEVVFEFTLDAPADVRLATEGSAFDTVLSVRTDCELGPDIDCDDDGGPGVSSLIEFAAEADVTYSVVVNGYLDGDVGDVVLTFDGVLRCVDDAGCPEGERCVDGACEVPPPPECVVDEDCPGVLECQDGVCARPPGVGSCEAALMMDGFGLYQANSDGAFDDLEGSCGSLDDGPEQVFVFTLEAPHRVTLDTGGSDHDTTMTVHTACDPAAEIACDDDGGDGNASRIVFDAQAGQVYTVVVHGYREGLSGEIALDFSGAPICLNAGDCAEGEACFDGVCRAGSCGGAIEMDGFGDYAGNNAGAADDVDAQCGGINEGPEQVFTFQFDDPADVVLDTNGTGFDTVLSVRTDCGDVGSELACDDDGGDGLNSQVEFFAEAGVRYYVIVDGYDGQATGDIALSFGGNIVIPPAGCDGCDGICVNELCAPPIPAACEGATIGEVPNDYRGDTSLREDRLSPSCANSNSPEDVLVVMFPRDTMVTASTAGTGFDTVLYALAGCDQAQEVACNDDGGLFDVTSEITFEAEAGVPYYIVVDGFGAASGPFNLSVR